MKKFTLYLGLNDKETKKQEISTIDAYKVVTGLIANRFGGGTIFEARGIYKHDNGVDIVVETTFKIELLFTTREAVVDFIGTLKRVFNQESIAMVVEDINSELI